tara:strand:- start:5281 stop:5886 length:606 start_codon:yes stop_codon:yes gene_type:complete
MTLYVSKVSKYQTERLQNMKRHLKARGIEFNPEHPDAFSAFCTTYKNEQAYAKALALLDRNKLPSTLDMDLTPFLEGRYDKISNIDGIYAKLTEIGNELEYHKYEQAVTKMYGNQMKYQNGWICHKGGELQPSDEEFYRMYQSLVITYGHYLYSCSANSNCEKYRSTICAQTLRLATNKHTKPVIIKRIKNHVAQTMENDS